MKTNWIKVCFFLILSANSLFFPTNSLSFTFYSTYGLNDHEVAESIKKTIDGGYIMSGYTYSYYSVSSIFVIKTDSNGEVQWDKIFWRAGSNNCQKSSVFRSNDGGYFLIFNSGPYQNGTTTFDTIFILKLTSTGSIQWQKSYQRLENSTTSDFEINSVTQTLDGGLIIAGGLYSSSGSGPFILKVSESGLLSWTKSYANSMARFSSIKQTNDGKYIVAGKSYFNDSTGGDFLVCRLDEGGNILWQKTYGGSKVENALDIVEKSNGGYTVVGTSTTFIFDSLIIKNNLWMIDIDSNGNVIWQKAYSEPASNFRLTNASDSGFLISNVNGGPTQPSPKQDARLIKVSSSGSIEWINNYGGAENELVIAVEKIDDGFAIYGNTQSFGDVNFDSFIIKTDFSGNIEGSCSNIIKQIAPLEIKTTNATAFSSQHGSSQLNGIFDQSNDIKAGTENGSFNSSICISSFQGDLTSPPAPVDLKVAPYQWTSSNSFSINWTNPQDPSGIAAVWYKIGTEPLSATDGLRRAPATGFSISATAEGGQKLFVWLEDGAGNKNHNNRASVWLLFDSSPADHVDVNGDGKVDLLDLVAVSQCSGKNPVSSPECKSMDIDLDGDIDTDDLNNVSAFFGCIQPARPTLSVSSDQVLSGQTFTFSWNSVANATRYILEESTDENFSQISNTYIMTPNQTSYQMSNMSIFIYKPYYYRLFAENQSCSWQSEFSLVKRIDIFFKYIFPEITIRAQSVVNGTSVAWELYNLEIQPGEISSIDGNHKSKKIPVILIHGHNNEIEYASYFRWQTLLSHLNNTANFRDTFDIWIWKHDSSKAIGFNGYTGNSAELSDCIINYIMPHYVANTHAVIVAHSRGGLIARSFMNYENQGDHVYGLITLGTPHHGTPGAVPDWAATVFNPQLYELNKLIFNRIYGVGNEKFNPNEKGAAMLAWDNMDNAIPSMLFKTNLDVDIAVNEQMWLTLRDLNAPISVLIQDETVFYWDRWSIDDWKTKYGTLLEMNLSGYLNNKKYFNKIVTIGLYDDDLTENATLGTLFGYIFSDHEGLKLSTYMLGLLSYSGITKPGISFKANDGLVPIQSALFLDISEGTNLSFYDDKTSQVTVNHQKIKNMQLAKRQYLFSQADLKDHLDLLDTGSKDYWNLIVSEIFDFVPRSDYSSGYTPVKENFMLDLNGNYAWNGCQNDKCIFFGTKNDLPVAGKFNGGHISQIGVFRQTPELLNGSRNNWFLDLDGDRQWSGCESDECDYFGTDGDLPVVGDWNNDGFDEIGVFRAKKGMFYLDHSGNGMWNEYVDQACRFGMEGDIPVAGDWAGADLGDHIGVFRPSIGKWFLDFNGNGQWDGCGDFQPDRCHTFGTYGDLPVVGDWNGDGKIKIGVFRPSKGIWYFDLNGNGQWDGCSEGRPDGCYTFGTNGDLPVVGDWNGDGITEIGVFRPIK